MTFQVNNAMITKDEKMTFQDNMTMINKDKTETHSK